MNSFNFELYKLAGYSLKLPGDRTSTLDYQELASHNHKETGAGYVCIFNWSDMRYQYISESIKSILGYGREVFLDKGFNFSLSLIHPSDMEKLREIHKVIFNYYYGTPIKQRAGLRFSYNFRVKAANNSYIHILRQSSFTGFTEDGKPTLEYINSTDITRFSSATNITLTVHRLSKQGIYTLCYEHEFSESYPALSEREKQVMELARQGLKTREIASKLYLSMETVKSHRKNIIAKTGALNMTAAIHSAYENKAVTGLKIVQSIMNLTVILKCFTELLCY